jgi:hypothetical protein
MWRAWAKAPALQMRITFMSKPETAPEKGPTYHLNIEGVGIKEWHENTITTEQLVELAGWEAGQQFLWSTRTTMSGRSLRAKPFS